MSSGEGRRTSGPKAGQRGGAGEELGVGRSALPEPLLDGEARPGRRRRPRRAPPPAGASTRKPAPFGGLGEARAVLAADREPQVAERPEGQVRVEPVDGGQPRRAPPPGPRPP